MGRIAEVVLALVKSEGWCREEDTMGGGEARVHGGIEWEDV